MDQAVKPKIRSAWKLVISLDRRLNLAGFFVFVACLIVAIAVFVASIFAPEIASESSGIAASKQCGLWEYDRKAPKHERLKDFQRTFLKEDRAAQYAQNCYGLSQARLDNSIGCDRFHNQNITIHRRDHTPCPFNSSSICLDSYGAVSFWTDLVPASHLGINSGQDIAFRRNTTCSPIQIDKHFELDGSRYHYYYGKKGKGNDKTNYTYYTDIDVLDWEIPQYSLE
jgi:hypothetical protein